MKAPLALSLVAAVLLGGVIYLEENRISELNKQIDGHRKNAAGLTGQLSRLNNDLEGLRRQLADSKALIEQLQGRLVKGGSSASDTTDSTKAAEPKEGSGAKWMKGLAKMFTDPKCERPCAPSK
jgi:hypothetical protein